MGSYEVNIMIPADCVANIFGEFDCNVKQIEKVMKVTMIMRGEQLKIMGERTHVEKTVEIMNSLVMLAKRGNQITEQNVDYALSLSDIHQTEKVVELDLDVVCHTVSGKPIKAKTIGQRQYLKAIDKNMVVFGVGPAGTGKTYLAMAKAITAFKNDEINRIILTRPAIEAGEKLGFLPGDLQSKVDPYLRPLYDALYEIMGADSFVKNMEKGLIEVAPLAYMRGRTLDNAFIVLDEAQNTTPAQMKMFLTRIGFGSKAIITGDLSQKDIPRDAVSGLDVALKVLSGVEGIAVCTLTNQDVVRHPLVQRIVKAYDDYETKQARRGKNSNSPNNAPKRK
ncbi:MAG: PhoH family protein [Lachnospiraceae bacterium]|nr:PhoH family protein [Lachnospiraceae bacterium]